MPVYIGLVHYPVYNKNEEVITTAITNFDLHDISRAARTYDVAGYFIIHPLDSQKALADEIIDYWQTGFGGKYNPDRRNALSIISVVSDISDAVGAITVAEGTKPLIVTTDARRFENTISYKDMRNIIKTGEFPVLVLFGTGWGIEKTAMSQFDYILEPVLGAGSYNHLSVRSAAAIILDRLLGENWYD